MPRLSVAKDTSSEHTLHSRSHLNDVLKIKKRYYYGFRGLWWIWCQTLLRWYLIATLFIWIIGAPIYFAPLAGCVTVIVGLYGYAYRKLPRLPNGRADLNGALTRIRRRTFLRLRWPDACEGTGLTHPRSRRYPTLKHLRPAENDSFTADIHPAKVLVPLSAIRAQLDNLADLCELPWITVEGEQGKAQVRFHWTPPLPRPSPAPMGELYTVHLDALESRGPTMSLLPTDRRDELASRMRAATLADRMRESGAHAMPRVATAAKTSAKQSWPWLIAFARGLGITYKAMRWIKSKAPDNSIGILISIVILVPALLWYQLPRYGFAIIAILVIVGLVILGFRPPDEEAWWKERRLVKAMTAAGILSAPKSDQPPIRLGRVGKPVHDDHGTTIMVKLPPGMTVANVQAKRDALASALNFPTASFVVSAPEGKPANVVRLWGAKTGAKAATRPPDVAAAERTDWHEAVRVGETPQGYPVTIGTFAHNVLVAGQMGYGKTSAARILALHTFLDPTSRIWLIDGKGSTKDWGAARSLCERFILGTDDDAIEAAIEALQDILRVIAERHATSGDMPADHRYGALALIADEWQEIRLAAKPPERDTLDNLLSRIVSKGRAVGGYLVMITQRPTKDMLPTHVKALVDHQICLKVRNLTEATYVLAGAPTFPLPTKVGHAIVGLPGDDMAASLDYLTEDAWKTGCARAEALRASCRPSAVVTPYTEIVDAEIVPDKPSTAVPPLLIAARDVLSAAEGNVLATTKLWDALPAEVRSANAVTLGKTLTALGVPSRTVRKIRVRVLADVVTAIEQLS